MPPESSPAPVFSQESPAELSQKVLRILKDDFDTIHGGFGAGPQKFLFPDSLELLLYAASEWKDWEAKKMLQHTLSHMARGGIFDPTGGFFTYADTVDWMQPHTEKLLSVNSRMARIYLDAFTVTSQELFQDTAYKTLTYMRNTLFDAKRGAFYDGQEPSKPYYSLPGSQRDPARSPPVRKVFCADSNSMAAIACWKAYAVFGETEFLDMARSSLSFLRENLYQSKGLCHSLSFEIWEAFLPQGQGEQQQPDLGRLEDGAWAVLAFTEACLCSGDRAYRDFAGELLEYMLQNLWDREGGGFLAFPLREGKGEKPLEPQFTIDSNALAFEGMWRLSHLLGNANYLGWLEEGIKKFLSLVPSCYPSGVSYARLVDLLKMGRMDLELVGRLEDPGTLEIARGTHALYLPRKMLSFIDPEDQDFVLSHHLNAQDYPRLFFCKDGRPIASASEPSEISKMLGLRSLPQMVSLSRQNHVP